LEKLGKTREDCPPVHRFVSHDFTDDQLRHITGCAYCQRMNSLARRIEYVDDSREVAAAAAAVESAYKLDKIEQALQDFERYGGIQWDRLAGRDELLLRDALVEAVGMVDTAAAVSLFREFHIMLQPGRLADIGL